MSQGESPKPAPFEAKAFFKAYGPYILIVLYIAVDQGWMKAETMAKIAPIVLTAPQQQGPTPLEEPGPPTEVIPSKRTYAPAIHVIDMRTKAEVSSVAAGQFIRVSADGATVRVHCQSELFEMGDGWFVNPTAGDVLAFSVDGQAPIAFLVGGEKKPDPTPIPQPNADLEAIRADMTTLAARITALEGSKPPPAPSGDASQALSAYGDGVSVAFERAASSFDSHTDATTIIKSMGDDLQKARVDSFNRLMLRMNELGSVPNADAARAAELRKWASQLRGK